MKHISSLVDDINALLVTPTEVDKDEAEEFGREVAEVVTTALKGDSGPPSLRMSNLGTPCRRKLWYTVRAPQTAEPLPAHVRLKFLYGHLLESILLFFAKISGHEVRGRQDEVSIGGVKGHRDAVIERRTVDVKSATTHSFKKFKEHGLRDNDPFGYIDQVNAYRYAALKDGEDLDDKVSFLAVDKQLGNLCLDTYEANDTDYEALVDELKEMVTGDKPPKRFYSDVPEGKSGNRKLDVNCSYCPFKKTCWPDLRTFIYSNGPVFLTHVEREPNVPEANGKAVF